MTRTHWQRPLALAAGLACALAALGASPAHAAPATHLIVNEVFGGGGNAGAPYANDFVELYNPTGAPLDLTGFKLSYYSAAGNLGNTCTLSGTVGSASYFLVQEAAGANTAAAALPTPDAVCAANMSGTSGSVVLLDASGAVVDLVGYGTATKKESAPAPAASNTTSVSRTGFADTDNNAVDFTAGAPSPMSSATTPPPAPVAQTATIAEIQGTGAATPLAGKLVQTTGVVTASYPTGGFNGFYLQTPGTGGPSRRGRRPTASSSTPAQRRPPRSASATR